MIWLAALPHAMVVSSGLRAAGLFAKTMQAWSKFGAHVLGLASLLLAVVIMMPIDYFLAFVLLPTMVVLPFVLFQKHLLPLHLAILIGRLYFWLTVPLTYFRCWQQGKGLWCEVDDTLLLGVVPLAWLGLPSALHKLGVRAVVNMQDEYCGPEAAYGRLGIEQLWLPTVDHEEPRLDDLRQACRFIERHRAHGTRVYVHCKAGHGRGGAVALAWMAFSRRPLKDDDLRLLNAELLAKRRVRPRLHAQPNLRAFAEELRKGGTARPGGDEVASSGGGCRGRGLRPRRATGGAAAGAGVRSGSMS
eukprot:CAMPEP_0204138146 /NCGR_PEP_ID=MMETSP0361-20130328/17815_1 /ASSEMBLY_ACC=CAM_ASM_000343 /TAXON_ID=268821 /ORGANISM="Scrippsiella Hangoei, Strain SHTV-5" /LENGTH=302 /DNA_ID=CAMNT_0051091925 /DNA_START=26 /DNA_END=931 /DNA_ORIENTATION=+